MFSCHNYSAGNDLSRFSGNAFYSRKFNTICTCTIHGDKHNWLFIRSPLSSYGRERPSLYIMCSYYNIINWYLHWISIHKNKTFRAFSLQLEPSKTSPYHRKLNSQACKDAILDDTAVGVPKFYVKFPADYDHKNEAGHPVHEVSEVGT